MRIDYGEKFWRTYFYYASARRGAPAVAENPAIEFTRKAKHGDFDSLSDDEYNTALHDCEEEAAFYLGKKRDNATAIFLRALRSTPLRPEEVAGIVGILSDASARVDYTALAIPEHVGGPASDCPYTPQSLYEHLDERIYGQEDAKRAAALLVYNHQKGRRRCAVFAGPTGCGKTEIWRTLSEIISDIHIYDGSMLTADGWKGSLHVRGIFESVPAAERDHMIIVLDEADKMLEPAVGGSGQDYSLLVQNNLLKIMDGGVLSFDGDDKRAGFSVDCSSVSVVLLGAFETLLSHMSAAEKQLGFGATIGARGADYASVTITPEDLIRYGNMRREIAGRVHSVTQLHPMTEEDFRAMLGTPYMSPVDRLSREYGIRITLSDNLTRDLCRQAAESRLGVRFIQSRIQERVDDLIFMDPARKEIFLDVHREETETADMS